MQTISKAEIERYRAMAAILREKDAQRRQQEIDRENQACDRCWRTTTVLVGFCASLFMLLDMLAQSNYNNNSFAAPAGFLFFVFFVMLTADGCMKLGLKI